MGRACLWIFLSLPWFLVFADVVVAAEPAPSDRRNAEICVGIPTDALPPSGDDPVWGFADLHVHPMAHRAFGSDPHGNHGLFHGQPGLDLETSDPLTDLEACDPRDHVSRFDADLARQLTRSMVLNSADSEPRFLQGHPSHQPSGAPDFAAWPHARSKTHQMVHITWLRRAYEGGLRLVVTAAVGNELLTALWQRGAAGRIPEPSPGFAFREALEQVLAIRELACANADWMQVVTNASDARHAIHQGKLAVIISAEMDSLTLAEIRKLRRQGLALITPIHLADNTFGGAAVFDDTLNVLSGWLNHGSYFDVVGDPDIRWRLGWPSELTTFLVPGVFSGVIPNRVDCKTACALGYGPVQCDIDDDGHPETCSGVPFLQGHRNRSGLQGNGVETLLKEGFLVDVAHMSQTAMEQALDLATTLNVPVLNSHTRIRQRGKVGSSERAMRLDLAKRMADLGGVLGFGTGDDTRPHTLLRVQGGPLARLTGDGPDLTLPIGPPPHPTLVVDALNVTIRTGKNGLRQAEFVVTFQDGTEIRQPLLRPLQKGSPSSLTLELGGRPVTTITELAIEARRGDLASLIVTYQGTDEAGSAVGILTARGGAPLHRFSSPSRWREPIRHRASLQGPLSTDGFRFWVQTGKDSLRPGSMAELTVTQTDGHHFVIPFSDGLRRGSRHQIRFDWPTGRVPLSKIAQIGLTLHPAIQGLSAQDNWDVQAFGLDLLSNQSWHPLTYGSGAPALRLTGSDPGATLYENIGLSGQNPSFTVLRVTVQTQRNALNRGPLTLELHGPNGLLHRAEAVNHTQRWGAWSRHTFDIDLDEPVTRNELVSLILKGPFQNVIGDAWDIGEVVVKGLPDPVPGWIEEYRLVQSVMGEGQVALGSDINGLSPQIGFTGHNATTPCNPNHYGVDVGLRVVDNPPPGTTWLPASQVGSRTFTIRRDGIAHIGMLPDFIQVVSQQGEAGIAAAGSLFQSAEAVLRLWELVEQSTGVIGDSSVVSCPRP